MSLSPGSGRIKYNKRIKFRVNKNAIFLYFCKHFSVLMRKATKGSPVRYCLKVKNFCIHSGYYLLFEWFSKWQGQHYCHPHSVFCAVWIQHGGTSQHKRNVRFYPNREFSIIKYTHNYTCHSSTILNRHEQHTAKVSSLILRYICFTFYIKWNQHNIILLFFALR